MLGKYACRALVNIRGHRKGVKLSSEMIGSRMDKNIEPALTNINSLSQKEEALIYGPAPQEQLSR